MQGTIKYILSGIKTFVNYDSDNGWHSFINNISQTPKITKEVENALLKLPKVNMEIISSAKELGNIVGYTSDDFYQFAKSADMSGDLLAQYKEYLQSTAQATTGFGAKIKSVGTTLAGFGKSILALGANIVASMAISAVITGVISLIDDAIHHTERLIEAGEEAQQKIADARDEYNKKSTLVNDSGDRFEELRKGINQKTNENISLPTEEYNE